MSEPIRTRRGDDGVAERGARGPWTPPAVVATRRRRLARPPATRGWTAHQFQQIKGRVHRRLLDRLNLSNLEKVDREQVVETIRRVVHDLLSQEMVPLNFDEREILIGQVLDEIFGLGPLEPLVQDPTVSDILVNTYQNVFIERNGKLERTDVRFQDDKHLLQVIDRIVSAVGRRIDDSSPMVDARLPDGSRVNAIIQPLAVDGPHLSIRKFKRDALAGEDLLRFQSLNEPMLTFLKAIVQARLNVLISGGTGAGKTTLLNILSSYIPATERIVTIEDSAELQLRQPHVVRLETRPANIEGTGEVPQRMLLVNSLRMRPDRIIMGEVRGPEAVDMLQAMNTGHDGSLTTLHANSPRDALSRLETMISMASLDLPGEGDAAAGGERHQRRHPGRPPFRRRQEDHPDLRDRRNGGRSDHHAGHLHVRARRDRRRRQGARDIPGHRHPPALLRSAEGVRHRSWSRDLRRAERVRLVRTEAKMVVDGAVLDPNIALAASSAFIGVTAGTFAIALFWQWKQDRKRTTVMSRQLGEVKRAAVGAGVDGGLLRSQQRGDA